MKLPAETVNKLRQFYDARSVLVTGGAGFIGGHLCDALLSLGASISVLDDLSNATLDHLSGLIELEPERVRFVHGSILDDEALHDAFSGLQAPPSTRHVTPGGSVVMSRHAAQFEPPAVVFHLAAIGSVPRSIENPQRTFAVNATGTLRVLEAARRHGTARVVLAASSSAYGDTPSPAPKTETLPPNPRSPYAASKLAAEHLVAAFAHSYALSGVSLRYFNVFGPRQPADSDYAAVIPAFAKRLLNSEPVRIFGDGSQTRDFTAVGNAVLATLLAGASKHPFKGEVINVGAGRRTSLLELAAIMHDLAARDGSLAGGAALPAQTPTFEPARPGDVQHSLADLSRARELLAYQPATPLEEGLAETFDWYRRMLAGA